MLADNIEVLVLTHPSKTCLTTAFLQSQIEAVKVYTNPDWELPPEHPEYSDPREYFPPMKGYCLRQYRAFRGHQELCRGATQPYALIFEDDARPNCTTETWTKLVNNCIRFLHPPYDYDVVSLHGRDLSRPFTKQIQLLGRNFVELPEQEVERGHLYFLRTARLWWPQFSLPLRMKWHIGCLAYLIGERGRQKWLDAGHGGGMPCDLFMVNMLNALVCEQSPFDHMDEQVGSIIENRGECRRRLAPDGSPLEGTPGNE